MGSARLMRRLAHLMIGGLLLAGSWPLNARARSGQPHARTVDGDGTNALIEVVRESTDRFHDVAAAEAEGYKLMFGCVSGSDSGATGLHYVNLPLLLDGELDPTKPEIVIYEPLPNGHLRLIGADYLVLAADWDKKQGGPPQIMGQLLQLFESPNRFGLPTFYTLHVGAWKDNPSATFVNWHSTVSCDASGGQNL